MYAAISPLLTGISMLLAVPVPKADPDAGRQLTELEKKLLGAWNGRIGCDGRFVFRSDGTYALTDYGPAGADTAGTWKIHWNALPPTLILTCRTSELDEEVGTKTEFKLIQLNDRKFAIQYGGANASATGRYTRDEK